MQLNLNIPDDIAALYRNNDMSLEKEAIDALAAKAYSCGIISHGRLGILLGMDYWEVEGFLKKNGIKMPYSAKDLADDLGLEINTNS